MASQELEPCLRMAISHVRVAAAYLERLPGGRIDSALQDMDRAVERIEKYAAKKGVNLRDGMKT